jgi:F-type H+-transporting ATPase subunit delta
MSSSVNLIATRYVRALFELAQDNKQHDSVKADMLMLKGVLSASADLRKLLSSPVVTRADAEKAIVAVLQAIKASELTKKFFTLLAHQRRLAITSIAIEKYLAMLAESRGELDVQVTSAEALDASQIKALTEALSRSTGKKVEIATRENPALIGGVQVRIGSRMLDNSIAGKLSRLRQALTKAA